MPRKLTVAVDFDGVLHSYTSKWVAPEVIPDPPVEGAIAWLNDLASDFVVYIHTTRATTAEGCDAIQEWLARWGYTGPGLVVTNVKLPAHVYIDDRAYRFTGENFPGAEEIRAFDRWKPGSTVPCAVPSVSLTAIEAFGRLLWESNRGFANVHEQRDILRAVYDTAPTNPIVRAVIAGWNRTVTAASPGTRHPYLLIPERDS